MATIVTERHQMAPADRRFSEWAPLERMRALMRLDRFGDLPRCWLADDNSALDRDILTGNAHGAGEQLAHLILP